MQRTAVPFSELAKPISSSYPETRTSRVDGGQSDSLSPSIPGVSNRKFLAIYRQTCRKFAPFYALVYAHGSRTNVLDNSTRLHSRRRELFVREIFRCCNFFLPLKDECLRATAMILAIELHSGFVFRAFERRLSLSSVVYCKCTFCEPARHWPTEHQIGNKTQLVVTKKKEWRMLSRKTESFVTCAN